MSETPEENIDLNPGQPEVTSREATEEDKLTKKVEATYDASSITVLEGLEAVRKRPGMYVGDNGKKGLHQMFREALDNGVDEAMAGHADQIDVILYTDGSISVEDNGRGIPVGIHEKEGISALTVVMTKLHAGGKFGDGGGYKVSGGLHGVGISCTNALSEWMVTTVTQKGEIHQQRFEAGVPVTSVEVIGKSKKHGTKQHWKPDPTALTTVEHDPTIIRRRLKELAYLNPKVTFTLEIQGSEEAKETFFFERGIVQLVEDVNDAETVIHKPIYFHRVREDMELEVSLQYNTGFHTNILAYCNNIHQPDGGTHVSGFGQALTRVINSYARKMNLLKEKDRNFTADDVAEGVTAVISLKIQNPSYNSQDKVKLVTPEVQGATNSLVGDGLSTYLEENPAVGKRIVEKAQLAQQAREAARKAAEAVKRSSAMEAFGLPGKLSDCVSRNPAECELFLVEGDSAGGTVKQARDRMTQALLPLRGKILNVERARIDKALDNEEIKSLIAALGAGVDIHTSRATDVDGEQPADEKQSEHFNIEKLRYHKIIIMTDADVDGEHIRTLLLTFFYRYMKPLITHGNLYFAQPPLFVIRAGKDERFYAMDEEERDNIVRELKKKNYTITRFKGLGEMNAEELEETTMNSESRRLIKVGYEKEFDSDVEQMFMRLMGDKVEPRRDFIMSHAKEAEDLDWHY
ncbi:MAG: DNA gyrase subunit B [Armatimonadetes bacterium]|nr:DNA gyrase subunit B [Armatimonadota bacterium]MBS1710863.1 DNA gyrase subunit B [Armatimonadota bacterium]MBX3108535.1 DNA gyrase subunit B [Fimbriimonadaceae bacterium]